MSLSAQIRIEPPRGLMFALMAMGIVGVLISLLTLAVRMRVGQDVWVPAIFLALVVTSAVVGWLRHRPAFVSSKLKIHEDGRVELESTSADMNFLCRLMPDALFWPGLFVLRLQADATDGAEPDPVHTLIAMKSNLSGSSWRALARLMIWAQRKGTGNTGTADPVSSLSLKPTP